MEKTNNNNQLINSYDINKLHNKDIVFIKFFEDMTHVYIIKDVRLFNDVILKIVHHKNSKFILIIYKYRLINVCFFI